MLMRASTTVKMIIKATIVVRIRVSARAAKAQNEILYCSRMKGFWWSHIRGSIVRLSRSIVL